MRSGLLKNQRRSVGSRQVGSPPPRFSEWHPWLLCLLIDRPARVRPLVAGCVEVYARQSVRRRGLARHAGVTCAVDRRNSGKVPSTENQVVSRVGIVPERRGRRPKTERLRNDPDQRLERDREELSLNFASWNLIGALLKKIDVLGRTGTGRPFATVARFPSP
jgi:hypothetical protein